MAIFNRSEKYTKEQLLKHYQDSNSSALVLLLKYIYGIFRFFCIIVQNLYCVSSYLLLSWIVLLPVNWLNAGLYSRLENYLYNSLLYIVSSWSLAAGATIVECGDDYKHLIEEPETSCHLESELKLQSELSSENSLGAKNSSKQLRNQANNDSQTIKCQQNQSVKSNGFATNGIEPLKSNVLNGEEKKVGAKHYSDSNKALPSTIITNNGCKSNAFNGNLGEQKQLNGLNEFKNSTYGDALNGHDDGYDDGDEDYSEDSCERIEYEVESLAYDERNKLVRRNCYHKTKATNCNAENNNTLKQRTATDYNDHVKKISPKSANRETNIITKTTEAAITNDTSKLKTNNQNVNHINTERCQNVNNNNNNYNINNYNLGIKSPIIELPSSLINIESLKSVQAKPRILFLCNHISTADVPLIMQSFSTLTNQSLLWVLDAQFKPTNFGVVCSSHGDFFVAKNSFVDGSLREQVLKHPDRNLLVLFPEGGFLRKRSVGSNRYAARNNYPPLKYVTYPRFGAFKDLIDPSVGVTHIVDATLLYNDIGNPLSILDIGLGTRREPAIINYKLYNRSEINPTEEWLRNIWIEKERMLKQYYENRFSFLKGVENTLRVACLDWFKILAVHLFYLLVCYLAIFRLFNATSITMLKARELYYSNM